jgi:hypothetical protein
LTPTTEAMGRALTRTGRASGRSCIACMYAYVGCARAYVPYMGDLHPGDVDPRDRYRQFQEINIQKFINTILFFTQINFLDRYIFAYNMKLQK